MSIDQYSFRTFKIKQEETDKEHLTYEEIERFENTILTGENIKYQNIKDLFVFLVYTDLRFSGVLGLQKLNIVTIEGNISGILKKWKKQTNLYESLYMRYSIIDPLKY